MKTQRNIPPAFWLVNRDHSGKKVLLEAFNRCCNNINTLTWLFKITFLSIEPVISLILRLILKHKVRFKPLCLSKFLLFEIERSPFSIIWSSTAPPKTWSGQDKLWPYRSERHSGHGPTGLTTS